MDNFTRTHLPPEHRCEPYEKPVGTFLKIAGIFGLVMASPFIAFMALILLVCLTASSMLMFGSLNVLAPWALIAFLVTCFVPAVRDRLTGKHNSKELLRRIDMLQNELMDAKKHILELEEGAEFHRKLAETNSQIARSDYPVNVNLTVTKTDTSARR